MQRLALLKALGDNTRYAIYLEIARSPVPRSTADIADTLGLHPNTIRPHLERMREVGLLEVEIDSRGTVGRPTNRYSVASDAPSLGLEPPAFPALAGMLAQVAAQSQPAIEDVTEVGRRQGRAAALREGRISGSPAKPTTARACAAALIAELANLGFDPAGEIGGTDAEASDATIAFAHCPFRELAEIYPQLVCNLHRGIVEGFAEAAAEEAGIDWGVDEFHTLVDRDPCQVTLTAGSV
jgi:predicted ArsR family transcriptional regulator